MKLIIDELPLGREHNKSDAARNANCNRFQAPQKVFLAFTRHQSLQNLQKTFSPSRFRVCISTERDAGPPFVFA